MFQHPIAATRSEQLSKPLGSLDTDPATALADSALLDAVGSVEDLHILLIGASMLGVMCAAIRRGCAEVSLLSAEDRVEANSADLVVVSAAASRRLADAAYPDTGRPACLCARIACALAPLGSLALVLEPADAASGPSCRSGLAARVACTLQRHGLSAIRTKVLPDGRALLLAGRPLIGRLA